MRCVEFQPGVEGAKFTGEMPPPEPSRRPFVRFVVRSVPFTLGACVAASLAACTAAGGDLRAARDSASSPSAAVANTAAPPADSPAHSAPAATPVPVVPPSPAPPPAIRLAPLADTIAQRLVFAPLGQVWFTAAGRAKRLVVDLGRVDLDLKKDPARLAAFRTAAAARSPLPVGTRLRLRGAWGSEDATIAGFEPWNGRIVATLDASALVDSIARTTDPLVVSAQRVAQASPPDSSACPRGADSTFSARLAQLARETEDSLRASGDQPIYARLRASLKSQRSTAVGCFARARGIVIVTLYAGDYEWVRERVLLVGDSTVRRAVVRDLRFRAHEALHALDADGDGVDDLAARAWTPRGGGTVILKLAEGDRLERLAAGFAWER